jgi:membrane protein YdbS with pleckstrin-like domain
LLALYCLLFFRSVGHGAANKALHRSCGRRVFCFSSIHRPQPGERRRYALTCHIIRTAKMATTFEHRHHRCSPRYLRVRAVIEFLIAAVLAVRFSFSHWAIGLLTFVVLSLVVWFRNKCMSMYRFSFDETQIRTRKIFTDHIDVAVPIYHVQAISVTEGLLEAMLDAGTIEISTGSSQPEHSRFTWPHIHNAREVAMDLRQALSTRRSA